MGWTTPPDWFYQPMRWANLTLAQDDPGKYDPGFLADLVKRAHCDAASWNSGGIIAFYPTQIPYHRRNETMGDTDPLGYLVEGCRKLGIIATARGTTMPPTRTPPGRTRNGSPATPKVICAATGPSRTFLSPARSVPITTSS